LTIPNKNSASKIFHEKVPLSCYFKTYFGFYIRIWMIWKLNSNWCTVVRIKHLRTSLGFTAEQPLQVIAPLQPLFPLRENKGWDQRLNLGPLTAFQIKASLSLSLNSEVSMWRVAVSIPYNSLQTGNKSSISFIKSSALIYLI
jgi:hypothetical protein